MMTTFQSQINPIHGDVWSFSSGATVRDAFSALPEVASGPIRLAILETDTPLPRARAQFSGYGGVFEDMFVRACATMDPPQRLSSLLSISTYHILDNPSSYPDPEDIDAILITGSRYDAFAGDDWIMRLIQYTRRLLESGRVRVVGVCFGHQIIARALGAEVGRTAKGWEMSVTPMELTAEGKRLFGRDSLRLHQMHQDAVYACPPGVTCLGGNDKCAVQVMYVEGRLMGLQGHPEFTEEIASEVLEKRHSSGAIGASQLEDGMRRVGDEHDGMATARTLLRFLRE